MNSNILPNELIDHIINQLIPKSYTNYEKDVYETFHALFNLCLVNKEFYAFTQNRLDTLKLTHLHRIKLLRNLKINYKENLPQLRNILKIQNRQFIFDKREPIMNNSAESLSGSLLFNALTNKSINFSHVNEILTLFPESVHFKSNKIYFTCLTPFGAACMNPHVPLSIIEKLFQLGADPYFPCVIKSLNKNILYTIHEVLSISNSLSNDFNIHARNTSILNMLVPMSLKDWAIDNKIIFIES